MSITWAGLNEPMSFLNSVPIPDLTDRCTFVAVQSLKRRDAGGSVATNMKWSDRRNALGANSEQVKSPLIEVVGRPDLDLLIPEILELKSCWKLPAAYRCDDGLQFVFALGGHPDFVALYLGCNLELSIANKTGDLFCNRLLKALLDFDRQSRVAQG